MLADLAAETRAPVIAARFHKGLARTIAAMVSTFSQRAADGETPRFDTVALSGGCFQNAVLFEQVTRRLAALNFNVLTHSRVPANDGGVSLGQAAVAAAHLIGAGQIRQKAS